MSGIPASPPPTGRAPGSQRARIVDAMIASCAEQTFAQTTIADIVAGAGVSRTTFYKCFANKRACFDAAVESGLAEVAAAVRAATRAGAPPGETVRKATDALLALLAAKPALTQLLVGEAASVEAATVDRYRRLSIAALAALWDGATEAPEPRLDPSLAFGRAHLLVLRQAVVGEAATLPQLLPEMVYLAVAPFAGHQPALEQVRIVQRTEPPEGSA